MAVQHFSIIFMKKSELTIPIKSVYTSEAFQYFFKNDDADVISRHSDLRGCFGKFTHNDYLPKNKKMTGTFSYFMNVFPEGTSAKEMSGINVHSGQSMKGIRNATYIGTIEELQNDCRWLEKYMQQFIDFHVSAYDSSKCWRINSGIERTNTIMNFRFTDAYLYQIFFVLNTFRKLTQLTSRPYYRLAQQLAKDKWHDMSFINILLMMDATDICIPGDQKTHQFLFNSNAKWLTPESFKAQVEVLEESGLHRWNLHQCIIPFDCVHVTVSVPTIIPLMENFNDGGWLNNDVLHLELDVSQLEKVYEKICIPKK